MFLILWTGSTRGFFHGWQGYTGRVTLSAGQTKRITALFVHRWDRRAV